MRGRPYDVNMNRDMHETTYPMTAMPASGRPTELDRARRRRAEAAQGSPDWDAASEAVLELEAAAGLLQTEPPRRRLFLLEPSSTR